MHSGSYKHHARSPQSSFITLLSQLHQKGRKTKAWVQVDNPNYRGWRSMSASAMPICLESTKKTSYTTDVTVFHILNVHHAFCQVFPKIVSGLSCNQYGLPEAHIMLSFHNLYQKRTKEHSMAEFSILFFGCFLKMERTIEVRSCKGWRCFIFRSSRQCDVWAH